jgi:hypothetical protein
MRKALAAHMTSRFAAGRARTEISGGSLTSKSLETRENALRGSDFPEWAYEELNLGAHACQLPLGVSMFFQPVPYSAD